MESSSTDDESSSKSLARGRITAESDNQPIGIQITHSRKHSTASSWRSPSPASSLVRRWASPSPPRPTQSSWLPSSRCARPCADAGQGRYTGATSWRPPAVGLRSSRPCPRIRSCWSTEIFCRPCVSCCVIARGPSAPPWCSDRSSPSVSRLGGRASVSRWPLIRLRRVQGRDRYGYHFSLSLLWPC